MLDTEIIKGLVTNNEKRIFFEEALYMQYNYFIREGIRKFKLSYDDSFSAYSDAVLSVIQNTVSGRFNNDSSIKTYLYQIFSNKCIDIIRNKETIKQKVHQSIVDIELLSHLPDRAKIVIEKLIDGQKLMLIKKYLDTIGEKCKEILLLFEDGYTDKQIAEKLAYQTASVAKTSRLRCLEKIREKVKSASFNNE